MSGIALRCCWPTNALPVPSPATLSGNPVIGLMITLTGGRGGRRVRAAAAVSEAYAEVGHDRVTTLDRIYQIVIDVHGVGYEVAIPVSAYSSLPDAGGAVQMHIYQHVREDILALYGFLTKDDKALFEN